MPPAVLASTQLARVLDLHVAYTLQDARSGQLLSLGFGFVEVDSEDIAAALIKRMQVCRLYGVLQICS